MQALKNTPAFSFQIISVTITGHNIGKHYPTISKSESFHLHYVARSTTIHVAIA